MYQLSDDLLIESYIRAIHLHLSDEFIEMIVREIERRNIEFTTFFSCL
ncbi:sporulation histidine kinase inhibitor Sda [Massilibacterium senegalense]|nr:sporulation histidine kinase inhibitor Sda [Massilibacterium senegalense]